IHSCVGTDGREDAERVFKVIREADADIVALQEVDRYHAADESLLHSLEALPEYEVVYGPTFERIHGHFGNVLMSRFPIRSKQMIDLSVSNREPRGAVSVVIEHDD